MRREGLGGRLAAAPRRASFVMPTSPPPPSTSLPSPPPFLSSTEPHSDSYYQHDIEADMRREGLVGVNTVESDPRHRVVLGYLPA